MKFELPRISLTRRSRLPLARAGRIDLDQSHPRWETSASVAAVRIFSASTSAATSQQRQVECTLYAVDAGEHGGDVACLSRYKSGNRRLPA